MVFAPQCRMIGPERTSCDEGGTRATNAMPSRDRPAGKQRALAATILGSSMAFIDGSAVNVALPALQQQLAATPAETQWVVNAYLLLLGAFVLIGGSAGDRYGR